MELSRRQFVLAAAATAAYTAPLSRARAIHDGEVAWLDEIQIPPRTLPDDAPDLSPVLVDSQGRAIDMPAAWERRRVEIRDAWNAFLGPLECERPSPDFKVLEEDRPAGCIRQLIRYASEPGLAVEAYLLKPDGPGDGRPGVVALHSTVDFTIRQPAGLEGDQEDFFGLKLAQRGMVAICPRCFLWQGKAGYEEQVRRFMERHPKSKGMAKMLWDAARGLDLLAAMPEVDPGRLGAIGHSLGAKETLYLAAFDERVKVAVSSEGGIGTQFSNWGDPWYLGDKLGRSFKREHHELLALVAPRAFLLLGGDSADGDRSWPFIEAALPVYRLSDGPPRVGLFNHRQGHSVSPQAEERIYEWFDEYL